MIMKSKINVWLVCTVYTNYIHETTEQNFFSSLRPDSLLRDIDQDVIYVIAIAVKILKLDLNKEDNKLLST